MKKSWRLRWLAPMVLATCGMAFFSLAQPATTTHGQPAVAIARTSAQSTAPSLASASGSSPARVGRHHAPVVVPTGPSAQTASAMRIALILTLLALIPALAICMTPFVRIIIVLSMIRHAVGMPETPPNQVLISLALLLTALVMAPAFTAINRDALQPFMSGALPVQEAVVAGAQPLRDFMLRQVSDNDLKTVYDISKQPLPASAAKVGTIQLTSAFMLNELRVSFKIGFVVLLPFLLIDLVVASILLSLGMLMVPPSTLSLPLKVLMFVLINGWSLVLEGVVGSFK